MLANVLEILVGMGVKKREARGMIERATPHVGRDASVEPLLRAALREARLPSGVAMARETEARYARLAA